MTKAVLEVRGLCKAYKTGGIMSTILGDAHVRAVDDVNFSVGPGETVALVGASGSGKTTTGRLVAMLERADAGQILFGGKDVTRLRGKELLGYRRDVQIIFQNPYEALDPRFSVGRSLEEPLKLHSLGSASERREKVAEILEAVELKPSSRFVNRYPSDLSGGQLQRIAIARALILSPRFIIADEAVSMLDVSVRSGIMLLLLRLQEKLGLSCLFITHDLAVGRYMSQRMIVMQNGNIVEQGETEQLIEAPAHDYTRKLLSAIPDHR